MVNSEAGLIIDSNQSYKCHRIIFHPFEQDCFIICRCSIKYLSTPSNAIGIDIRLLVYYVKLKKKRKEKKSSPRNASLINKHLSVSLPELPNLCLLRRHWEFSIEVSHFQEVLPRIFGRILFISMLVKGLRVLYSIPNWWKGKYQYSQLIYIRIKSDPLNNKILST